MSVSNKSHCLFPLWECWEEGEGAKADKIHAIIFAASVLLWELQEGKPDVAMLEILHLSVIVGLLTGLMEHVSLLVRFCG